MNPQNNSGINNNNRIQQGNNQINNHKYHPNSQCQNVNKNDFLPQQNDNHMLNKQINKNEMMNGFQNNNDMNQNAHQNNFKGNMNKQSVNYANQYRVNANINAKHQQQRNSDQVNLQNNMIFVNNDQMNQQEQQTEFPLTTQEFTWDYSYNRIQAFAGLELDTPSFVSNNLVMQLKNVMDKIRTEIDGRLQDSNLGQQYKELILQKFTDTNKDILQSHLPQNQDNNQLTKGKQDIHMQNLQQIIKEHKRKNQYDRSACVNNEDDQSDRMDLQDIQFDHNLSAKSIEIDNSDTIKSSELQNEINKLLKSVKKQKSIFEICDIKVTDEDCEFIPDLKLDVLKNAFQFSEIEFLGSKNQVIEIQFQSDELLKSIILSFLMKLLSSNKTKIKTFLQNQIKKIELVKNQFYYQDRILRLIYLKLLMITIQNDSHEEENLNLITNLFQYQQIQELFLDNFMLKIFHDLLNNPKQKNIHFLQQLQQRNFNDINKICEELSIAHNFNILIFDNNSNYQEFQCKTKERFTVYIYSPDQLNQYPKKKQFYLERYFTNDQQKHIQSQWMESVQQQNQNSKNTQINKDIFLQAMKDNQNQ